MAQATMTLETFFRHPEYIRWEHPSNGCSVTRYSDGWRFSDRKQPMSKVCETTAELLLYINPALEGKAMGDGPQWVAKPGYWQFHRVFPNAERNEIPARKAELEASVGGGCFIKGVDGGLAICTRLNPLTGVLPGFISDPCRDGKHAACEDRRCACPKCHHGHRATFF